ncbi:S9 family peptidase [Peristeroidobacter soli]|uniref:S9 family peptidase n=1 Tax=Peristeroidobacter soli TaxID=2497877 RepID=UPI00101B843D|nr:S9 family peptidase [Peristeroidobacter soli]
MERDLRTTALYGEIATLFNTFRQPGTGQISDAAEVNASPDGTRAVFAGAIMDKLEGLPATRICLTTLATGDTRVLTFGPNTDRLPRFSPDGRRIAFLSDRHASGDFQLYLLNPETGAVQSTPRVDGWVEYLHWSPDGQRILLGVAGHGADIAGGQGAISSKRTAEPLPAWVPAVDTGDESFQWRRAWIHELADVSVRPIGPAACNIWESAWCGNSSVAAIVSAGPGEGLWYSARLKIIDIETGNGREIFTPKDQLGWPSASPSGACVAIVEAVCSDRWFVAGDLKLLDVVSGTARAIDTNRVDVTHTEWRSEHQLVLVGHRRFQTVIGVCDARVGTFTELWASDELTTPGLFASASGFGETGDCVLVGEGFKCAPQIAVIESGRYRTVKSFDLGYGHATQAIRDIERLTWKAPDGLDIEGWLLTPKGEGPHPTVMAIHGGPVGHWRPRWLARGTMYALVLIQRGYAVFLPNPRGSAGYGQEFARAVVGDMGGADTYDYLSGLDHLVAMGVADPDRLGVTGVSYGGFMSYWLITQDQRFAAAVPVAPVSNHVTQHLISNIPHFVALFLDDTYHNSTGKYFDRSPVMHAKKVTTPTLSICGALDRCTPPQEAVQFHNALLEHGVSSVLVTYPEEGHGIRKLPAAIDYTARLVQWFEAHLP